MHRLFHGRPPGAVGGGARPPMPPPGAGHVMPATLYNSSSMYNSSGGAAAATPSSIQEHQQLQQPQQGLQWWSPGWLAERARIQRLEMLDEVEEWQLLQVGAHLGEERIKHGLSWQQSHPRRAHIPYKRMHAVAQHVTDVVL